MTLFIHSWIMMPFYLNFSSFFHRLLLPELPKRWVSSLVMKLATPLGLKILPNLWVISPSLYILLYQTYLYVCNYVFTRKTHNLRGEVEEDWSLNHECLGQFLFFRQDRMWRWLNFWPTGCSWGRWWLIPSWPNTGTTSNFSGFCGCVKGTYICFNERDAFSFSCAGLLSPPHSLVCSVIMVDEAHERSISTDILLGLLKKVLKRWTGLAIYIGTNWSLIFW